MKELISSRLTIRGYSSEIQVGQQFKSFKELAGHFSITYSATCSNAIRAIEKELKQYFLWEKVSGRTLRIIEIFSSKQVNVASPRKKTYYSYAMPILGELLFSQRTNDPEEIIHLVMTNKELCTTIGVCNSKLFDKEFLFRGWKQEIEASEKVFKKVVSSNHRKNSQVVRDLREKVGDSYVAIWRDTYTYQNSEGKQALADTEVELKILSAKRYALEVLDCTTMSDVFCKDLYNQYKKISADYCTKKYGINKFQEVHYIISSVGLISSFLRSIIKEENPKQKLSRKVLTSLINSDIKKYYQLKDLYETSEELNAGDIPIYSENEIVQELQTGAQMHELFRY